MVMHCTSLRKIGLISRIAGGLGLGFLMGVGGLIFLFIFPPVSVIFIFLAVGCPFAFLGYRAKGVCPVCCQRIEVAKKYGGVVCKGCKSSLVVRGRQLFRVR